MTSEFEGRINITATDNASPVVDASTKNILANYKVLRQEVRAVNAEFQLQNQGLVAMGNAFRSVGSIAGSFMNIFTQYETMQIRVTDAQNQLILAQLHYNQVLAEQGPGTNDAIAASIQLQEAKQAVAQATQQETLGYIGMGLELGSSVSQIINAIPVFERLAAKLGLANAASVALNASLGAGTKTTPSSVASSAASGAASGAAASGAGAAAGLAARLGTAALRVAPGAAAAGAGVELLSMMGSQQAGGGESSGVSTGFQALSDIFLKDIPNAIANLFGGGQSGNNGQVQHVVTIQIDNPSDHIVTAQEKAMGIQQVYQSGQ